MGEEIDRRPQGRGGREQRARPEADAHRHQSGHARHRRDHRRRLLRADRRSGGQDTPGRRSPLSFVLGGIVCAFAGLCYAEMASTVPVAGSAYTYAYATMGEFIAWLIGWDLILEYMVGATTVAINWSGYVASFLHDRGIDLPARFLSSPGTVMIEVPDAVAGELHLRHGWSMLESVKDRLDDGEYRLSALSRRSRPSSTCRRWSSSRW